MKQNIIELAMPSIHQVATLTSKGQVTLPKSVRQVLGLETGDRIAFSVREGEVVVTRAESDHDDPALEAFLTLLEADIRAGRHVQSLPQDLAQAMLRHGGSALSSSEDIDGDVEL